MCDSFLSELAIYLLPFRKRPYVRNGNKTTDSSRSEKNNIYNKYQPNCQLSIVNCQF